MSPDEPTIEGLPREAVVDAISTELDRAYAKHGRAPWGRHEFFGIIKEEFDEMWDDIKADAPQEQLFKEVVQVAAMCFRYLETGDRYRGSHPPLSGDPAKIVINDTTSNPRGSGGTWDYGNPGLYDSLHGTGQAEGEHLKGTGEAR